MSFIVRVWWKSQDSNTVRSKYEAGITTTQTGHLMIKGYVTPYNHSQNFLVIPGRYNSFQREIRVAENGSPTHVCWPVISNARRTYNKQSATNTVGFIPMCAVVNENCWVRLMAHGHCAHVSHIRDCQRNVLASVPPSYLPIRIGYRHCNLRRPIMQKWRSRGSF